MSSDAFATSGATGLNRLSSRGVKSDPSKLWRVVVQVPAKDLKGNSISQGCVVGFDGELSTWMAPGDASIDYVTRNVADVCWNDYGSASYLVIRWYEFVQEAVSAPK